MPIRLRLTLWYSGLLAVALVAFGVIIYSIIYNNTINGLKGELKRVADRVNVQGFMSADGINLNAVPPQGMDANLYGIQLVNYAQDRNGKAIDKSNILIRTNITFPVPEYSKVEEKRIYSYRSEGAPFLIYEKPLLLNGTLVGLLQIGAYIAREEQFFALLQTILWSSGAFCLVAAFVFGMFLSRKALLPIGRITEAAEQIQSGSSLGLRIPRERPNDEIGRLTDTLNGMLTRIEKAYNHLEETNAAQRRFVSDASHELRTPLTTIRGNSDLLYKMWSADGETAGVTETAMSSEARREMSLEAVRDISEEARRMSGLVGDLLSLARADAGYEMEMELLPLRQLAEEAARRASFLPRKAEWNVGPLFDLDDAWVNANHDYLLQLLFILIENAFKYTPSGEVRLFAARSGDRIGLVVADTGIGIREEDLPHIFDRFYRADPSRGETSGTGLGLSIAKWIADMHQGHLEVRSRPAGGTVFTLWLPLQPAPSGISETE